MKDIGRDDKLNDMQGRKDIKFYIQLALPIHCHPNIIIVKLKQTHHLSRRIFNASSAALFLPLTKIENSISKRRLSEYYSPPLIRR